MGGITLAGVWLMVGLANVPDATESPRAYRGPLESSPPAPIASPPRILDGPHGSPGVPSQGSAKVAPEQSGPPFYNPTDVAHFRARFGLDPDPPRTERKARWRCLVADPTCPFTVEVVAMSAYAYRVRQGGVDTTEILRWHSARAQYDLWLDFPVLIETTGRFRYVRMSLGPKGGVIASDGGQLWGNVGFATRYWFDRRSMSLALEFTSALSFQLRNQGSMQRSPVGFAADVGLSLGGFGALVIGGQYDPPLASEEVPDRFRVSSGGMFFAGFRGNVVWGVPAALAVTTHALAGRLVATP